MSYTTRYMPDNEPGWPDRTPADMLADLLHHFERHEWEEKDVANCGRGCCGYTTHTWCPECRADKGPFLQHDVDVYDTDHREGCARARLLAEVRAHLDVEGEIKDRAAAAEREARACPSTTSSTS